MGPGYCVPGAERGRGGGAGWFANSAGALSAAADRSGGLRLAHRSAGGREALAVAEQAELVDAAESNFREVARARTLEFESAASAAGMLEHGTGMGSCLDW